MNRIFSTLLIVALLLVTSVSLAHAKKPANYSFSVTSCFDTTLSDYRVTATNTGNTGAYFRMVSSDPSFTWPNDTLNFPFLSPGQSANGSSISDPNGTFLGGITWTNQHLNLAWITNGTHVMSETPCE